MVIYLKYWFIRKNASIPGMPYNLQLPRAKHLHSIFDSIILLFSIQIYLQETSLYLRPSRTMQQSCANIAHGRVNQELSSWMISKHTLNESTRSVRLIIYWIDPAKVKKCPRKDESINETETKEYLQVISGPRWSLSLTSTYALCETTRGSREELLFRL